MSNEKKARLLRLAANAKSYVDDMSGDNLAYMLELIIELREGEERNPVVGICSNLNTLAGSSLADNIVVHFAQTWEHFSGNVEFPIEGYYDGGLWEGEQLASRMSLLKHLEENLIEMRRCKLHEERILAMPSEDLHACLIRLEKILEVGPSKEHLGICANVSVDGDRLGYYLVAYLSASWEHTTGNVSYPVPRPTKYSPLWTGKGLEYRQDLIKHMITKIEEILCAR